MNLLRLPDYLLVFTNKLLVFKPVVIRCLLVIIFCFSLYNFVKVKRMALGPDKTRPPLASAPVLTYQVRYSSFQSYRVLCATTHRV